MNLAIEIIYAGRICNANNNSLFGGSNPLRILKKEGSSALIDSLYNSLDKGDELIIK